MKTLNHSTPASRARQFTAFLTATSTLFCPLALRADEAGKPSRADLDAITARGRLLARYDRSASYATDAVQATSPDNERVRRYIAVKEKTGWKVLFGRLD